LAGPVSEAVKKESDMKNEEVIRKELLDLLRRGNAHMSFEEVIEDFPLSRINDKAPNMPYSAWHLLEHLRLSQLDIAAFVRDPAYESPQWPEGYFPAPGKKTDEAGWRESIRGFLADRAELESLIRDRDTDLFAPIPHARSYNICREILVIADHNAYHIGELALMRQVMQAWPPGRTPYDAR